MDSSKAAFSWQAYKFKMCNRNILKLFLKKLCKTLCIVDVVPMMNCEKNKRQVHM